MVHWKSKYTNSIEQVTGGPSPANTVNHSDVNQTLALQNVEGSGIGLSQTNLTRVQTESSSLKNNSLNCSCNSLLLGNATCQRFDSGWL